MNESVVQPAAAKIVRIYGVVAGIDLDELVAADPDIDQAAWEDAFSLFGIVPPRV